MAENKILIDSSFLYALYNQGEEKHEVVRAVAELYSGKFLIPYVILTEVAFLFRRQGGTPAVSRLLQELAKDDFAYEVILRTDLLRAQDIIDTYLSARFDFVDCCIMALAERLNITQVGTLDQRDFTLFRPTHCEYLEILP